MRNKSDFILNAIFMVVGSLLIGFGVAFVVAGNVGGDALTTLQVGISRKFHISVPSASLVTNIFSLSLLFMFFRKRISIATLCSPFLITLGNYLMSFVTATIRLDIMLIRMICMLFGLVLIGIGIGIGAQSPSSSNPYDSLIIGLSEKFKISFSMTRIFVDAAVLIAGLLLKGTWGIGTIIAILLQGVLGEFFIRIFRKKVTPAK